MRSAAGSSGPRGAVLPALIVLTFLIPCAQSLAAESGSAGVPPPARAPAAAKKAKAPARIDINSASRTQLKTLPGIGDAEAARIIEGRPYLSKADLASKNLIPTGIYLQIKDRIIAIQKQKPKSSK